jgi:predicted transcriptional regulator
MSTVKESLLEIVQKLPDECTWDEAMYQIYVRQKIEAGLKDADEGQLIDHDTVFEELAQ